MHSKRYEYLIVGSAAGGASVASELTKRGKEAHVAERGKREGRIGGYRDSTGLSELRRLTRRPPKSSEAIASWTAFVAGGSTVVSCRNGTRCLEKELGDLGISLEEELAEAEGEMQIAPLSEGLLSDASSSILKADHELSYRVALKPKFIDPARCQKRGPCTWGCPKGAKWTALG